MPTPEIDAIIWQQAKELHERHLPLDYEEVDSYYLPEMEAERDATALEEMAIILTSDTARVAPLMSLPDLADYLTAMASAICLDTEVGLAGLLRP